MITATESVESLFEKTRIATTDELANVLRVQNSRNRVRTIRNRLQALEIPAQLIGHQAWIIKHNN